MSITQTGPIKISKRMRQLLPMLETGLSNRDIAEKLGISEHTTKVHMWRMYRRIGVTSRTQAVAWWRSNRPGCDIDALVNAVGALLSANAAGGSVESEMAALKQAYTRLKGGAA